RADRWHFDDGHAADAAATTAAAGDSVIYARGSAAARSVRFDATARYVDAAARYVDAAAGGGSPLAMEKMPYQPELEAIVEPAQTEVISSDWRQGLPVLSGLRVMLRELRRSDASSLFVMLTTEEVSRFISPPPSTVEGFERFIDWTLRQRKAGTYACFA